MVEPAGLWSDRKMKSRRAFTLLELILTIAIIGLIVAFLYPDLEKLAQAHKLQDSSERLRSLVIMCRARAMHDGIKYRLQFPGTPDPLDRHAERDIDVPFETMQPEVFRQDRPLDFPDAFGKVEEDWTMDTLDNGERKPKAFLSDGVRCVAAYNGVNFDETAGCPIVGPTILEGKREFVGLTFNPDGTCDAVTFRLTDLPFDIAPDSIEKTRVLDLIVDPRTGQTWFQRAFTIDEMKVMSEYHASPILHMDFNDTNEITEANILMIQHDERGIPTSKKPSQSSGDGATQQQGQNDAQPSN